MKNKGLTRRWQSADIVVIGGGIIGLTIARALALRGVSDVCLIERGALGTEASFAAAGMLAPQAEADTADDFFTLACRSRDLYPSFAAALLEGTGIDLTFERETWDIGHDSVESAVDCYTTTLGPTVMARQLAESQGHWPELRGDMIQLFQRHSGANGSGLVFAAEYLMVLGRKAS